MDNLEIYEEYLIYVTASTSIGESPESDKIITTTDTGAPLDPPMIKKFEEQGLKL